MIRKSRSYPLFCAALVVLLTPVALGGCSTTRQTAGTDREVAGIRLASFRFREDFDADLNDDAGWAAPESSDAALIYDRPFRLRVQVRPGESSVNGVVLGLQYRRAGGSWASVGAADFPYPEFATPAVSAVSTQAYQHGAETIRLLGEAGVDWDEGAGLGGTAVTPAWNVEHQVVEWEWPLVVRRFADGPEYFADGQLFEFRVVDGLGRPLLAEAVPRVSMSAAAGHLGGTFVETPGRLGPYQSKSGNLYFFMEPTETDNRFMAVVSTDFGLSWREADPDSRPVADDLEGVATARVGDTIHIVHQVSREVFHHAFRMDGPGYGEWQINSQSIFRHAVPPTQFVDLAARSDGSLVALAAGPEKLFLLTRSAAGIWTGPRVIDQQEGPELSGPVLVTGKDDVITMAYTGRDGSGFIRHLYPDGALSTRQVLSTHLGSNDAENGAILPMVTLPDTGTTVVLFREEDGMLYERRFSHTGVLSDPVKVSDLPVITNAVDSEQAGADLVYDGSTLHLAFIEASSQSIFHSYSAQPGIWSMPRLLIDGIEGSWIRGSIHRDADGLPLYGFVYDAGSQGGAGLNRYFPLSLNDVSE